MWEIKPAVFLSQPKNQAKVAALNLYCLEHGYNARVVTLKDLEGMEMQVGLRPWVGAGKPWVDPENQDAYYQGVSWAEHQEWAMWETTAAQEEQEEWELL